MIVYDRPAVFGDETAILKDNGKPLQNDRVDRLDQIDDSIPGNQGSGRAVENRKALFAVVAVQINLYGRVSLVIQVHR